MEQDPGHGTQDRHADHEEPAHVRTCAGACHGRAGRPGAAGPAQIASSGNTAVAGGRGRPRSTGTRSPLETLRWRKGSVTGSLAAYAVRIAGRRQRLDNRQSPHSASRLLARLGWRPSRVLRVEGLGGAPTWTRPGTGSRITRQRADERRCVQPGRRVRSTRSRPSRTPWGGNSGCAQGEAWQKVRSAERAMRRYGPQPPPAGPCRHRHEARGDQVGACRPGIRGLATGGRMSRRTDVPAHFDRRGCPRALRDPT